MAEKLSKREFSEGEAWADVGEGWKHLHGSFRGLGYSMEWHDFETIGAFDWAPTFHPGGLEICLNLAGTGNVGAGRKKVEFAPLTAGFYFQKEATLHGVRTAGERHQFITIELSSAFLKAHLPADEEGQHPLLRKFLCNELTHGVSQPIRLTGAHQQMIMSLRKPPVYAGAHRIWYHAKALEVAAALFYHPGPDEDLFCQRQKNQNTERVEKVIALLKENLSEPLSLEEIGKRVGCSHYYLSRIFTQEMGKPIFQYLRNLRMDRAAELLLEGRLNVTQVALEVGYSSPSHFSTAFHDAFGCCPGLYPLTTAPQLLTGHSRQG
ncbi:MAG TPA: AraC family transcriptional regulator [Chthoniobacteraceae bacterium]|nr:AraC family transcriptional regulator [Chthoniobacteraceae bacterium]